MKKYGGVNNQKPIDEIQEAVIVSAPIFRKKQPKSKASAIIGWFVYFAITWFITSMLLMATGINEQLTRTTMPLFVQLGVIPSMPFFLTLMWSICKAKKAKRIVDAGD